MLNQTGPIPQTGSTIPVATDTPTFPTDVQPQFTTDPSTGNTVTPAIPPSITPPKKKFGGGRIIATILGILLLVGGVGAGLILTQQQQLFQQKASTGVATASCGNAKTYSANWTLLTDPQLASLAPNTVVNFCATGSTSTGSFDKAQFTINGIQQPETTTKRPGSNDFCQSYTIKVSDTTMNVTAKIHHTTFGWR